MSPFPAAAEAAIRRVLGNGAATVDVSIEESSPDFFEVSARDGRTVIRASSPALSLAGLRACLATTGDQFDEILTGARGAVPHPPAQPLRRVFTLPHRFYGNDTEDAYVGPYRDFAAWEDLIDGIAARGYTELFVPVGTESAYVDLLTAYGYSREEALAWIPLPSHQPWWLLQNMSGYPSGMNERLLAQRTTLGRRIVERLQELGMRAVLPGYGGTVPRDFGERNSGAHVTVPSGDWQGFDRPGWLDPSDPMFPALAATFYASSARHLGAVTMYKTDLLHEGGQPGDIDVSAAGVAVQRAMLAAAPESTWVMLGWQHNPPREVLAAVERDRVLVVDGLSDRYEDTDREEEFLGTDYAFGGIWNFGGDTAMGAQASTWTQRFTRWRDRPGSHLRGVAAMPEGGFNNPLAMDLLAELSWRADAVQLEPWVTEWVRQRYGRPHAAAEQAWRRIVRTAYSLPDDNGFSEPHDSLFAAWPSFTVGTSSSFSPAQDTYDLPAFAAALPVLLAAAEELSAHRAYRFDLADVARQAVTNTARQLLPVLAEAAATGELARYDHATDLWLSAMDLLDRIAGTQQLWLLGRLLDEARAAGEDEAESDRLERSQRLILTSWGPERAATQGQLSDYAGRDAQGLVGTLYRSRWSAFLAAARPGSGAAPLTEAEWWARDQSWVDSVDRHGIHSTAEGDIIALADEAVVLLACVQDATRMISAAAGEDGKDR
ncbi:alpha-N-acetylglucosaminidase [Microbacterium nymphoidis]|uniref:alpha-N-acetylglucosaminidase n=1 Tax=Microbacterium nymphoidis TaxID=2898586 RepID=UPI001E3A6447|nr:alpha-N-acetylglucosaminidase TIM-barrel domain-containing protein [Microbacterium nymphoidis]MCD2498338.1 alpha-N-acetylglucosaminidase [Microbacterium nymphoidis]